MIDIIFNGKGYFSSVYVHKFVTNLTLKNVRSRYNSGVENNKLLEVLQMTNYKFEKDYLYCDGYFRQKSLEDAVLIVDKLLVKMIKDWNEIRHHTPLHIDDLIHEEIDALRDCLYYLTGKDEYNNDPEIREKLHKKYYEYQTYYKYGKEVPEETEEGKKLFEKLHKVKLKQRRAGRVIIKEELWGEWAIPYLNMQNAKVKWTNQKARALKENEFKKKWNIHSNS